MDVVIIVFLVLVILLVLMIPIVLFNTALARKTYTVGICWNRVLYGLRYRTRRDSSKRWWILTVQDAIPANTNTFPRTSYNISKSWPIHVCQELVWKLA